MGLQADAIIEQDSTTTTAPAYQLSEAEIALIHEVKRLMDYAYILWLDVQYGNNQIVSSDELARYDLYVTEAATRGANDTYGFVGAEADFKKYTLLSIIKLAFASEDPVGNLTKLFDPLNLGGLGLGSTPTEAYENLQLILAIEGGDYATSPFNTFDYSLLDTGDLVNTLDQVAAGAIDADTVLLDEAGNLVAGYRRAERLDKNREQLTVEALQALAGWSRVREGMLLDQLGAEIQKMRKHGNILAGISVEPIIAAFESYHGLMQFRQEAMRNIWSTEHKRRELNLTDEDRIARRDRNQRARYLTVLIRLRGWFDPKWLTMDTNQLEEELNSIALYYIWKLKLPGATSDEGQDAVNRIMWEAHGMGGEPSPEARLHAIFFILGFFPVIGPLINLAYLVDSLVREDYLGVAIALLPYIGEIAEIVITGRRVINGADELIQAGDTLAKQFAPEVESAKNAVDNLDDAVDTVTQKISSAAGANPNLPAYTQGYGQAITDIGSLDGMTKAEATEYILSHKNAKLITKNPMAKNLEFGFDDKSRIYLKENGEVVRQPVRAYGPQGLPEEMAGKRMNDGIRYDIFTGQLWSSTELHNLPRQERLKIEGVQ